MKSIVKTVADDCLKEAEKKYNNNWDDFVKHQYADYLLSARQQMVFASLTRCFSDTWKCRAHDGERRS